MDGVNLKHKKENNMTIQQLRAQIAALQDATMDENRNFRSAYDEGKFDALTAVDTLLGSLQKEEPISEDLEEAAKEQARSYGYMTEDYEFKENVESFKTGAQWRKKQMMAKAFDAEVLENYNVKVINYDETILDEKLFNCKIFDKVKVIVVKEE